MRKYKYFVKTRYFSNEKIAPGRALRTICKRRLRKARCCLYKARSSYSYVSVRFSSGVAITLLYTTIQSRI